MPPIVTPGASAGVAAIYQFAAPTAYVSLGTTATTISTAQVPAISLGVCDVYVRWGTLSLNNTATSAVSVTISSQVGGTQTANVNGLTPNAYLGAASGSNAVVTTYIETDGYNVPTNSPFTVTLAGLGSAAGVNAYLRINGTITVFALFGGAI